MNRRRILFACHTPAGESLRSARAIANLDDVEMSLVSGVHDTQQLIDAAQTYGNFDRIVTAQETLLLPVAEANEALGLEAMSSETVKRTLDKSQLKATLRRAGVKTPDDQIVTNAEQAHQFANEIGFPIIIKPLDGSGALTTFTIRDKQQLARLMQLMQPSPKHPILAERRVLGVERCFDTITIDDEPQFYSVCDYNPSIIHALENPERQWQCVMPRELGDSYRDFIAQGLAAARALAVGNAMTHMEGFQNRGRPAGFVDATLRPAGARIAPMFGFACDVDPYRVWARVAVDGCFDGPLERKYVVGTIFLRGLGSGVVQRVEGIDTINEKIDDLLVEAHWPKVGAPKSPTYTGDGFITIRHGDYGVIRNAIDLIERTVKITYSSTEPDWPAGDIEARWSERLHNYKALNKPAWEATL